MRIAADHGLAENLASALWALGFSGHAPTMRDVAADLRCDPSNATLLIGHLEDRGLVARRADPRDRRRRVVSLTTRGGAIVRAMGATVVDGSPLAALTDDQLTTLEEFLNPGGR